MTTNRNTIILEGDRELDELFATLTDSISRKALRAGVQKVGTEIIKRARANLRALGMTRKRGEIRYRKSKLGGMNATVGLAKSFYQRPSRQWPSAASVARKGIIGATAGFRYPQGAHAHLIEFGHQVVLPQGRSWDYSRRPPGLRFVKARPFWRPAEAEVRPLQAEILATKVRQVIAREVARARRKKPPIVRRAV